MPTIHSPTRGLHWLLRAEGLALIWLAHIGFDRVLGYGLKSSEGFAHRHLGVIKPMRKGEK